MNFLKFNFAEFNLSELIKDERVLKVREILLGKNIRLLLEIDKEKQYRGRCSKNLDENIYNIYICVKTGLCEDIFYFNKRGVLGDIWNPSTEPFVPKNSLDIGVYSIIFTILHEYKHYLQYCEGLIDGVDISVNSNNKYVSEKAQLLEEEAESFALKYIVNLLKGDYSCLY